jgi:hypothetical protein
MQFTKPVPDSSAFHIPLGKLLVTLQGDIKIAYSMISRKPGVAILSTFWDLQFTTLIKLANICIGFWRAE